MLFDWLAKKAARSFLTAQKELQKEERFKEAYKGRDTGEACLGSPGTELEFAL